MNRTIAPAVTVLMPISVLSLIPILIGSRGAGPVVFCLNTVALALNVLSLIIVVVFEVPVVNEIVAWTSSSIPENWQQRRDHWIAVHKTRVFTGLASLLSLVIAALIFEL